MPPTQKIPFSKQHLSLDDQIAKFKNRNIIIDDIDNAKEILSRINYFRLKNYARFYENHSTNHTYRDDTKFSDIVNLYKFDKKLRELLLDPIETIEIAIKTKFSYHLSEQYGAHAHLNRDIFKTEHYDKLVSKLTDKIEKTKTKQPMLHYLSKYQEPTPSIWVMVDIMDMGDISKWYENIKITNKKQLISKDFGLNHKVLTKFLHKLTLIRNKCAHHSIVWNAWHTNFRLPRESSISKNTKIYKFLIMIDTILNNIKDNKNIKQKVEALADFHNIDKIKMGFPY